MPGRKRHAVVAIKPRQIVELQSWQRELEQDYGYPMTWWNREELCARLDSPRYLGGLHDANAGHLHPLKYALGLGRAALAAGVRIFEASPVLRIARVVPLMWPLLIVGSLPGVRQLGRAAYRATE